MAISILNNHVLTDWTVNVMQPIIRVNHLCKYYYYGKHSQQNSVLNNVNLSVKPGEFLSIVGPSGSGKTTLIKCIAGLLPPSTGTVNISGRDPFKLKPRKLAQFRRTTVGIIFQQYNLVPYLSPYENAVLPLRLAHDSIDQHRVTALMAEMKLNGDLFGNVTDLSGGEQQKIAIARTILSKASVIFADEPTGALDSKSGFVVMQLLQKLVQQGTTLVMVTHNLELVAQSDRAVILNDGRITHSILKPTLADLLQLEEETS